MIDEVALARLARQYSREAVAALVFAVRNSGDLRIKVAAALALLDRGYGRPAQAKPPAPDYTQDDVDRMIAYLERKVAAEYGGLDRAMARTSHGEALPDAGVRPVRDRR